MLKWVNILHLHQPPHQDESVVKKVAQQSYSLIVSLLLLYPNLKLTINISGSLIELFKRYGLEDILIEFEAFCESGRMELMATAMYHPLLPLIPEEEVERQIDLYLELFKKTFPGLDKPKGFFLPEMAYNHDVARIIKKKGFSWIVLDELHADQSVNPDTKYRLQGLPLHVLFRNRKISTTFPPQGIFEFLSFETENMTLITAHDGELYGHWHQDDRGFYKKAFTHPNIEFLLASDFIESLQHEQVISIKQISWETSLEDEKRGAPYPLWQHPDNKIQNLMWKFADACIKTVNQNPADPGFLMARHKLDRGLTSCAWWWMSGRKIGPLSPISWHPSETKKGLDELIEGIRALTHIPLNQTEGLEKQYQALITLIFNTHAKITQK